MPTFLRATRERLKGLTERIGAQKDARLCWCETQASQGESAGEEELEVGAPAATGLILSMC